MYKTLIASGFVLLCHSLLHAADFSPAAQAELEKLQGNWVIISTERDGKEENKPVTPTRISIQKDQLLINGTEVGLQLAMLHVDSNPKLIDIGHPETKKLIEGIYELKEKEWIVCINGVAEGAAERPANFDTAVNSKFVKVVLQRE